MAAPPAESEASAVRERYARRRAGDERYRLSDPAALAIAQERQRAIVRLLAAHGFGDFASLRLLEVGSGGGGNLLELLWLGFRPEHLAGIELLPERHAAARARLPEAVRLMLGDAVEAPVAPASFDIVYVATVFSSLLDDVYQKRLADAMWRATKPGGGVLCYDFTVDNPRNPDVRGVPLRRVRELFPEGSMTARRVTLLPPLARAVARLEPRLYSIANVLPALRTHVLALIRKSVT